MPKCVHALKQREHAAQLKREEKVRELEQEQARARMKWDLEQSQRLLDRNFQSPPQGKTVWWWAR